jgi:two-component system NtrC family response regulator
MVKQGEFREDLLFRLKAFSLEVPPLRAHREDIKELVHYYVTKLCENYGIAEKNVSSEVFDVLLQYNWPGNVRELVHTLERAISAAPGDPVLFQKHFPTTIRVAVARASVGGGTTEKESTHATHSPAVAFPKLQKVRESATAQAEQQYLEDLLALTQGDIQRACRVSGVSRSRLYALMKKYRLHLNG